MIATHQLSFAPPTPAEPEAYSPEERVLATLRLHGDAFSRGWLSQWTALPDRTVREAITNLRKAGHAIVSTSDGSGYRLAKDGAELAPTIAEFRSRMHALRDVLEGLERAQYALGSQAAAGA